MFYTFHHILDMKLHLQRTLYVNPSGLYLRLSVSSQSLRRALVKYTTFEKPIFSPPIALHSFSVVRWFCSHPRRSFLKHIYLWILIWFSNADKQQIYFKFWFPIMSDYNLRHQNKGCFWVAGIVKSNIFRPPPSEFCGLLHNFWQGIVLA